MGADLKCGSLFSGIGGFDRGFELAGIRTVWQVEKDHYCRRILERHFPQAKRYTDVTTCRDLEWVNVITAGVPCQDVSVAGKRAGLAGERTVLVYEFARILQEVRPDWFVFENVPGLFSSNKGRDFAEILRLFMVECGYGVSWRVLDSRYFGVAQRRKRVFLVGRLGEPCPPEILFEPARRVWDPSASEKARQDIAVPLTSGSGGAGTHRPGRRQEDDFNLAYCLREDPGGIGQGHNTTFVAAPLVSRIGKGPFTDPVNDNVIIAGTLLASTGGRRTTDLDGHGAYISAPVDANGMRNFAMLPEGLDSARYRALGNAVTVSVAEWIAKRIVAYETLRLSGTSL